MHGVSWPATRTTFYTPQSAYIIGFNMKVGAIAKNGEIIEKEEYFQVHLLCDGGNPIFFRDAPHSAERLATG